MYTDQSAIDPAPSPGRMPLSLLYAVFSLSGFAALSYQVVWQRSLFAIYGVNIESVTIVVSAFMLGLGLGSHVGGLLSEKPGRNLLMVFGLVELCIGAFGVVSLALFRQVGAATAGADGWLVFALTFVLVLLPTSLMGMTLPLLTAHVVAELRSVGHSVGMLYFTNTLGSALASVATATVLMVKLGQLKTTWVAAACNVVASLLVLWHARQRSGRGQP